ncbi:Retrovirus-related Pol polyprotein from transposon 17.6, partial [Mucuna pruriens]
MILGDNGDIESEGSQEETSTSRGEECSSEEVPYEGNLFMVRRLISTFIENDQSQRENIFYSRCMVSRKNGGSSVNVASLRLVEKLCLQTIPHPNPYKLQWLSEQGEMYKHEILCDVVLIEVTHVLLGRPWQFDRKVRHDGVTNKFSFVQRLIRFGLERDESDTVSAKPKWVSSNSYEKGEQMENCFKTKLGLCEWFVMPFRLTNAPSTFIRLMNHVLISLIDKCVVVYFNDILAYSNCVDDHVMHVKSVLLFLKKE